MKIALALSEKFGYILDRNKGDTEMEISSGNYTAKIKTDGEGSIFAYIVHTSEDRVVNGVLGKHYASMKTAETAARKALLKVA